ncbi:hypothetical protein ACX3VT_02150 [Aerococcus sanguinicola]|uniref:hypothetical protein n=1 Tax=unclassified Aerococcus TaxID=2618060 RepID=UPI0008A449DD|nr:MULTISPECIES: hypothetical protein [unclassified Aerococcus]KAB0646657.1 hypothetical protein F6I01_06420 [Aerococcus sanguinicola]MDK6233918.1 hypothetical protein [Aerococcus sp. UMB10185]MDK6856365.1 hypothetical protein [Aerococcus sp. UMB7533]OFN03828.1 hypothetical protein HMPREF2626_05255 [Aerococcus sp. HMSC062A02]OHO46369.1 hypothetical protein HMPREF2705_02890 [Aerococcus sp. HMSC035B07]
MSIYGLLTFYLLEVLILYHQFRTIKRIRIKEKCSRPVKLTYYIISLCFLVFGLSISQALSHLGLFLGLGLIFFLAPQTTGLGDHAYYHRVKLGGFAGLTAKEQSYAEVLNYRLTRKEDSLVLVFSHKFRRDELTFSLEDQEAVERLLKSDKVMKF